MTKIPHFVLTDLVGKFLQTTFLSPLTFFEPLNLMARLETKLARIFSFHSQSSSFEAPPRTISYCSHIKFTSCRLKPAWFVCWLGQSGLIRSLLNLYWLGLSIDKPPWFLVAARVLFFVFDFSELFRIYSEAIPSSTQSTTIKDLSELLPVVSSQMSGFDLILTSYTILSMIIGIAILHNF